MDSDLDVYAEIEVFPLATRKNLLDLKRLAIEPDHLPESSLAPELEEGLDLLAERIRAARRKEASVMLTYGAHLVKNGAMPLVNRLIRDGWINHVATQGAGTIHDWEFAFQAFSGESVRENAPVGRFGSWDETGKWLNLAVLTGAADGLGLGASLGRLITGDGVTLPEPQRLADEIRCDPAGRFAGAKADLLYTMRRFGLSPGRHEVHHPYKAYSIVATAYECGIPMTVHPGIGYDIIVNHPYYHGGAIGRASTTDARMFTMSVDGLEGGGIHISVGSAIMSPQVFEKAFSAANNVRNQQGRPLLSDHFLTIVDLQDGGGWDWSHGEPPSSNPAYYLRYCKSFYRMGGTLDYLQMDNRDFLIGLVSRLCHH